MEARAKRNQQRGKERAHDGRLMRYRGRWRAAQRLDSETIEEREVRTELGPFLGGINKLDQIPVSKEGGEGGKDGLVLRHGHDLEDI